MSIYHNLKASGKGKAFLKKGAALLLGLTLTISSLAGCGEDNSKKDDLSVSRTDFILNTVVSVTLYGTEDPKLIEGCFNICRNYEEKLSRTKSGSEVSRINNGTASVVSGDTAYLIQKGLDYGKLTDGALDISIGSVSSLWDFLSEEKVVPSPESVAQNLRHVGYQKVSLDGKKVLREDALTALDLGAIAKGFIADEIKAYLLQNGQKSALINLGGNILCVGSKPSGKAFKIGIQTPFDLTGTPMITFSQKDLSVVTSGVYERYFEDANGNFYHHILDPTTGYPVNNNLYSVSIVSEKSVDGDCLSTACFCLGQEKATDLINSMDGVYAIFIDDEFKVTFTDGFKEAFPDVSVIE